MTDTNRLRELLAAVANPPENVCEHESSPALVPMDPSCPVCCWYRDDTRLHVALLDAIPALLDELDDERDQRAQLAAELSDALIESNETECRLLNDLDAARESRRVLLQETIDLKAERDAARAEVERLRADIPPITDGVCEECGEEVAERPHTWSTCTLQMQRRFDQAIDDRSRLRAEVEMLRASLAESTAELKKSSESLRDAFAQLAITGDSK